MTEAVHKFLENGERSKRVVAAIGIVGGLVLLVAAIATTFMVA